MLAGERNDIARASTRTARSASGGRQRDACNRDMLTSACSKNRSSRNRRQPSPNRAADRKASRQARIRLRRRARSAHPRPAQRLKYTSRSRSATAAHTTTASTVAQFKRVLAELEHRTIQKDLEAVKHVQVSGLRVAILDHSLPNVCPDTQSVEQRTENARVVGRFRLWAPLAQVLRFFGSRSVVGHSKTQSDTSS